MHEAESQETYLAEREELSGRKALLPNALKTLNERERRILAERRLEDNPTTLEELSERHNVSRERVRQIALSAFAKLQRAMKSRGGRARITCRQSTTPVSLRCQAPMAGQDQSRRPHCRPDRI